MTKWQDGTLSTSLRGDKTFRQLDIMPTKTSLS